jgi:choline dehydrogenase-like flavoprotein
MAILDLSVAGPDLNETTSFCVVGAGIAGLLLATRLARRKRRVIVLESGSLRFDPEIHALNEIDDPDQRYSRALTGRYRGLGGSSSRWGGRMIPISPADSSMRQHIAQPEWPIDQTVLDTYQQELEALFSVGHDSFDEIDSITPGLSGLLRAEEDDFKARWAKCPTFKRCNIVTMLGNELRSSQYVTVWLNATVGGFGLDREAGRLVALKAQSLAGRQIAVAADQFVIAAGTIESTRLLLLLDEASDRHAFARTDALGCYFQDHLKAEVAQVDRHRPALTNHLLSYRFVRGTRRDLHLELSHDAQASDAVSSAFVYVSMDLANSGLAAIKSIAHGLQQRKVEFGQVGAAMKDFRLIAKGAFWRIWHKQLYVPPGIPFRLMTSIEQLPHPQNRITLSDTRDRLGMPRARFDWKPRAADERTFRATTQHLKHYWQRSGFDNLCPLVWDPAVADRYACITDKAEACAHPSGSTRMGTDPTTSVVGPDLRCHALPNVAVASAAVFPTAGSANPTFTIMKLALWLADSYRPLPLQMF